MSSAAQQQRLGAAPGMARRRRPVDALVHAIGFAADLALAAVVMAIALLSFRGIDLAAGDDGDA
jgi:hypothetical protein